MQAATNREMIKKVADGLGDVVNEVVFVGGAVTELMLKTLLKFQKSGKLMMLIVL